LPGAVTNFDALYYSTQPFNVIDGVSSSFTTQCLYCCYIIYCMLPLEVNKVVQWRHIDWRMLTSRRTGSSCTVLYDTIAYYTCTQKLTRWPA